jgi:exopolysaccharide production protein ExoQ
VTGALWIPVLWLTIIGSRCASEWLNIFGVQLGSVSLEDGSPIDSLVFGLLIVSGSCVLVRRQISLVEIIRNNRWLTVFVVYCFLAVIWSDFPLVAFKRWLKVLGHPIVVLVVLTEPDPEEAVIRLLKRCAYVWVPVSILFIKYYPQWGRGFDFWTGEAFNAGITPGKNALGLDCFIVEALFFWYFLKIWRMERSKERRNELALIALFLAMNGWLLNMSHSSTSLVSFLTAAAILVFLGLRSVDPRHIGIYFLGAVLAGVVAEEGFGIYAGVLHLLGKNPTLTDRTLIWQDLLQMNVNPVLGTGFESFWLGERLNILWDKWWWQPNSAHNAYLETYLNLGFIGLFLLIGWLFVTYRKARRDLIRQIDWGRFRLAFLLAVLLYGWTEAAFRALDPVYFMLYLIGMDYPKPQFATAGQSIEVDNGQEEREFASVSEPKPGLARYSE